MSEQIRRFWGSHTRLWRWLFAHYDLTTLADIKRRYLLDYVDHCQATGYAPGSINHDLNCFRAGLLYLQDQDYPVPPALLRLPTLKQPDSLPRFLTGEQVGRLRDDFEQRVARATSPGKSCDALLDRAAFYLFWQGGLRTGEVRRLRQDDLNLEARRARIEQSKGLKDRIVYLSRPTVEAIQAYLPVRGPANTEHVFLFRHKPLSVNYCLQRMGIYSKRCGIKVTPHQLRHSSATLLLNAGAPILTVQMLLGHKFIDTTLKYARLYDGTIANDFYRAMTNIESRFDLDESPVQAPANPAQILAMVDALQTGTLNDKQRETVQSLREAILTLTGPETNASDEASLVIDSITKKPEVA